MSSFDTDVMEDLYYDEAEGPSRHFDEYDEFGEDEGDELLGAGFDEAEEGYEAYDDLGDEDLLDAMEEAVVDALEAEDTDEFFRRLARGIRGIARRVGSGIRGAVRTVGRGISRVAPVIGGIARTLGPIASLIPGVGTAVGTAANVLGSVLPADEFDTLDDLFDYAEDEDAIDAAAPVIAGLTIRRVMPGVARLPRGQRRQLVRSVTQATRAVARRQGPQAARAVPGVVRTVQRAVQQRRIPPRAAPRAIVRAAARVAQSPRLAQQMAVRAGTAARPGRGALAGRGTCPACRGRQVYRLQGPVTLRIQGR